jgi:hypothetical protein
MSERASTYLGTVRVRIIYVLSVVSPKVSSSSSVCENTDDAFEYTANRER